MLTGKTNEERIWNYLTAAVDSGAYTNFAKDSAGYGLAQWTYHTRKAALLAFAKAAGKSVGDLETQLAFLVHELECSFSAVLSTLKTARTIEAASNAVLLKFERPANQGEAVMQKRAQYGQVYYDKFAAGQAAEGGPKMNKKPVSYLQTDARWKNKPYRGKGRTPPSGTAGAARPQRPCCCPP